MQFHSTAARAILVCAAVVTPFISSAFGQAREGLKTGTRPSAASPSPTATPAAIQQSSPASASSAPAVRSPATAAVDTKVDRILSQTELAEIFKTAPSLLAEARTQAVFSQFRPGQQVQLAPSGDTLKVTATGNDPQVLLPGFIQGKQFIIQAVVESPVDTVMELYYLRRGMTGYAQERSQSAPLLKGRNTVYFRFNAPDIVDPLRMDIGTAPGQYTVVSMIARVLVNP